MATHSSGHPGPILDRPQRSRITGAHLYQLMRCERAVYLEWFGNPRLALPPDQATRFFMERGRRFEAEFMAELGWPEPRYRRGDLEAGFASTLELLRRGVPGVGQGVLLDGDLAGIPDLLRREEGPSELGDFHYVVGDIKSGRTPRGDQWMQVAFYSHLLARVQGREPAYGYLVLGDGQEVRMPTEDLRHRCLEAVDEIREMLAGPPPPVHLRQECARCRWRNMCASEAEATDDLSRLPGMTWALRAELEERGVATVDRMLALAPGAAEGIPGLARPLAGARALARREPVFLRQPSLPAPGEQGFLLLLRDPFLDRLVLLAALLPQSPAERWWVVEGPEEEAACRSALLGELWTFEGPVFHAGGDPGAWLAPGPGERGLPGVDHRLVDLSAVLRAAVVLPGRAQGLREAARWLKDGEDLTEEPAGLPLVWYERWRTTGEDGFKQRMVDWALRELRLLRAVHSWLLERGARPEATA